MTPFLQRTVLILLGTSAICAGSSAAQADLFTPRYPTRLAAASPSLQPAVLRDDAEPQLILAARHTRSAAKGPPATVTVKKGDTLDAIADRLDVTVEQLKAANGLKRNTIQPGDVLKNPKAKSEAKAPSSRKGGKTAASEEAAPETYKVVRGDTIYSISKRFGVSMDALREANDLSTKAQIHTGQTLKLPGDTEAADAQAAEEMARKTSRSGSKNSRSREEASADTVEERSAAGRVVTVEGRAVNYTVRKGDNLAKIADKLDTTVEDLKADNGLKKSAIHPGQVLKGPRKSAKAYVAAPGDSLEEVATRFGVSTKALRAENGLSRNARIKTGQKLRLPAGYRDHGPVKTYAAAPSEPIRERPSEVPPTRTSPPSQPLPSRPQPYTPSPYTPSPYTPSPSTPQPYSPTPSASQPYTPQPYTPTLSPPRPYTPSTTTPPVQPGTPPPLAPQAAPPVTDAQVSALGRGRFVWPVRGEILSEFGPKAGGQRNDGLNVQAQAGDPVRAAAAGDVVYAGDQVPGFGNLVLIKHADGWVTAYGHLSHVDVKMQQRVTQGQQIGQAGSTGGVPEPQVHFEVRYAPTPLERARPIDPKLVLPPR